MKVILDLESTGLLDESSIDYSSLPYKLKESFKVWCIVVKDIETGKIYTFKEESIKEFPKFSDEFEVIIGHNIIDYDLLVLKLYFGLDFRFNPCRFNGRPIQIVDTLVLSKLLNPDRFGGHSLDSWGERLSFRKIKFNDWTHYSQEMLDYCIQDVEVNHRLYEKLVAEWGRWDWKGAFALEQSVRYYITLQSHFGFYFDQDLAKWCVDDLTQKMEDIEREVEPLLPPKPINKTAAKNYTPPKIQFKANGERSALIMKWVEKHGGKWLSERSVELFGSTYTLPLPKEPLVSVEPMKLSDQDAIKQYLVSVGWEPSAWREKDMTIDSSKQKVSLSKFRKSCEKYIEQTMDSEFMSKRLEHLKTNSAQFRMRLLSHDMNKPLKVLTAPSLTIGVSKEICPNLEKLGEEYDWVGKVVSWLTYRHRKNNILSENGTGWLTDSRLSVDGRIGTPADTLGASSCRFTHKSVANVPRVSSKYGEYTRALFGVPEGYYQIGSDSAGLEARIEGHYTSQFEGGEEYAKALTAEKPNDTHSITAKRMDITRDTAKSLKYSISYGAQIGKLAKTLGCSLDEAKIIFDGFWEGAKPLLALKERLTNYWKKTGNKIFIRGVDGRKIITRSEHSLINALFQSAGAIIMKRHMIMYFKEIEELGLYSNPFNDSEIKAAQLIHYHDETQWQVVKDLIEEHQFETKEEAEEFIKQDHRVLSNIKSQNDKYVVYYSNIGEIFARTMREAGEFYNLRVPLAADYDVGTNWAETH